MPLWPGRRFSPIGIDIGARAIKMAQLEFRGDARRLVALGTFELPVTAASPEERVLAIRYGISEVLRRGSFRGHHVVFCLNDQQLFVQNVRLPKLPDEELAKVVQWEAEERLPSDFGDAEVRHLVAGEIRAPAGTTEGGEARREVILLACRRADIEAMIELLASLHLRPRAIDVPACAIVRSAQPMLRRKTDEQTGLLFADLGTGTSTVVMTRGQDILFVKPLAIGGLSIDRSVARKLNLSVEDAALARRQWAESGADAVDPNLIRTVAEAVRGETEMLANELLMCIRYHSVTFRGNRIARAVLFGGEANPGVADQLAQRLDLPCDLGDPFLGVELAPSVSDQVKQPRPGRWAVCVGLCMKPVTRKAA